MASFPTPLPTLGLGREREVRASYLLEDRDKWVEEHNNRRVRAPMLEERASAPFNTLFYKILGENYWSALSHVPTSLMKQVARKTLCNDWPGLAPVLTLRPERWGIAIGSPVYRISWNGGGGSHSAGERGALTKSGQGCWAGTNSKCSPHLGASHFSKRFGGGSF